MFVGLGHFISHYRPQKKSILLLRQVKKIAELCELSLADLVLSKKKFTVSPRAPDRELANVIPRYYYVQFHAVWKKGGDRGREGARLREVEK